MAVHQRRTGLHPSPVVGRKGGGAFGLKKELKKRKRETEEREPEAPPEGPERRSGHCLMDLQRQWCGKSQRYTTADDGR